MSSLASYLGSDSALAVRGFPSSKAQRLLSGTLFLLRNFSISDNHIASVFCKAVYYSLYIAWQLISAVSLRQQALKSFEEYLVHFFFSWWRVPLDASWLQEPEALKLQFYSPDRESHKITIKKAKSIWGCTSQTPVTLMHSAMVATRIISGVLKY